MMDRILVLLASLMLAILITLGFVDYRLEYDVIIGIISISGFIIAIYNFIRLNK
jgi:hypothetical protein